MIFLNPVLLMSTLWISLLLLSNYSITGIDVPSLSTQLFIFFNVFFVVLGAFFYRLISNEYTPKIHGVECRRELNQRKINFYYFVFFLFVFIPISIPFFKAVSFIMNHSYFEYLALTRWSGGSKVEAFGSTTYLSIINYFFLPFSYALYFISLALYVEYKHKKLLIFSILALLMYSFLLSSRAEILMIILTMAYALAISKKLFNPRVISVLLVLSTMILLLSLVRFEGSFVEMLSTFVINYHTYGFSMLDKVLNNDIDLELNTGYGLYTFPFLSIPIEQISNILPGDRFIGLYSELIGMMSERQNVGVDVLTGELITANSFYTVLLPLYADFKWFSFLLFFIYGLFLYRSYLKYLYFKDSFSLSILLFLFFLGYNSLFFPLVMREFFWLAFFVLFFLQKLKIRGKYVF